MKSNSILLILGSLAFILITSCRLDVNEPEPFISELNQPVQENRTNYINYELNAEDFSKATVIQLNFSVKKATLILSLQGHSNGNVKIEIKNITQTVIFRTELTDNLQTYVRSLTEPDQAKLTITPQNFTGKLRIRITSGLE